MAAVRTTFLGERSHRSDVSPTPETRTMEKLTRGTLISIIAALPLAAAATGIASAADDSGGVKAQYKYQLKPGPGGKKCAGCTFFAAPHACKIVKGAISPTGYCIAYSPKPK
jgi:hypothetical protein